MTKRTWVLVPDDCPQARYVQVLFCGNPECNHPHVVLFDADHKPMATFLPSEGFTDNLKESFAMMPEEKRHALALDEVEGHA